MYSRMADDQPLGNNIGAESLFVNLRGVGHEDRRLSAGPH